MPLLASSRQDQLTLGLTLLTLLLAGPLHAQTDCLPPGFVWTWGSQGSGPGNLAYPRGSDVNDAGDIYVADRDNSRVQVRRANGSVFSWGSFGGGNGQFINPQAVAIDASQNVYVMDRDRIQKFTPTGGFLFSIPVSGQPGGVAVDAAGNIYAARTEASRIQKYSPSGTYLMEWGVTNPIGIACDDVGNIYVTSFGAITFFERVLKFTNTGGFVMQWGSLGTGNGQFDHAWGLAVRNGKVYVADSYNHRIQVFTTNGLFLTKWGTPGGNPGQFQTPWDVSVGADGSVYVVDNINHRIQKFSALGADCEPPVSVEATTWSRIKVQLR